MQDNLTEDKVNRLIEKIFSAVVQKYDATVSREDILLSNDVLFKCGIPSFVADFVSVVGWADSEGSSYNAQDLSALGNQNGIFVHRI